MVYTMLAFPTIFVTYGVGYWTAPLLMRIHDVSATEVGMYIGLGNALGGLLGVTLGESSATNKQWHPAGRLLIGYIAVFGTAPLVLWMVYTESLYMAFLLNFVHHLFSAAWPGIPPSTAADLVLPRMRAVAGAYWHSHQHHARTRPRPVYDGATVGYFRKHRYGLSRLSAFCDCLHAADLLAATIVLLTLAWRNLPKDEASRLERARALGEEVEEVKAKCLIYSMDQGSRSHHRCFRSICDPAAGRFWR